MLRSEHRVVLSIRRLIFASNCVDQWDKHLAWVQVKSALAQELLGTQRALTHEHLVETAGREQLPNPVTSPE